MDARAQKLWQRGMGHFRQGHLEAAQASFEAVLARQPESGPALFRLSMVQSRRGRPLAAIAWARRALAADPRQLEILTHLARCHLIAGQPELARTLALRALALPRTGPVVLDSLAVVLTRLDEPALALELFDQAIAMDPDQASTWFNRALAQRQFGSVDAAERDLEACIARQPGHAKAHSVLASLRTQDLASNHVGRLQGLLDGAEGSAADRELLALALFKECDDLGDTGRAQAALARAHAGRRRAADGAGEGYARSVAEVIALCDEKFCRPGSGVDKGPAPVFIFGMPRSGVALLGSLLSRHPKVQHLGEQQPFSRLLSEALGRDSLQPFNAEDFARCSALDLEALGRRYLAEVCAAGARTLLVCESRPINHQLVGLISRALPRARLLHMQREPMANCVSILAQATGERALPTRDPGELAAAWLDYQRLMQHWQEVLPGRIMEVSYESLVERPEMVLRVVCAFLGIRYGSALRMGLKLHTHSVGRGARYAATFPELVRGLQALSQRSLSA